MNVKEIVKNPYKIFESLAKRGYLNCLPDKVYIKFLFRSRMGRWPNFKNPQTFNEKLQWLKLYDRKPIYTTLVDKYAVKQYVAERIGEDYIIPTLGVWEKFDDIDFDTLPDQFVLKCTHDSGGIVICRSKKDLDLPAARNKIEKCLKRNFYWNGREWPYKKVKPRIIAEAYMEDTATKELRDYKFFCFNGEPKFILVCRDRFGKSGLTEDFYTVEWQHLQLKRPKHPNAEVPAEKPEELEQIVEISKKLSKGIPFVRTDFYVVNHKVYFGEFTFFPANGFERFEPEEWDNICGSWIRLPDRKI